MVKRILFSLLLLFTTFLYGQSFEYIVSLTQLFSEKGLSEFSQLSSEDRKYFIKENQYPKPSYYKLILGNDYSFLSYISSVENDQEDNGKDVKIAPLGFGESYRVNDNSKVILKHENLGKNIFSALSDLEIDWKSTGKDSLILGYKVYEAIGLDKKTNFEYKIWFTKELPSNLGIYNLNNSNGFVLAYSSTLKNPSEEIKEISIHVYPQKKLKLSAKKEEAIKNKINALRNHKIYTTEEVDQLYDEHNKRSNEMLK